MTDMAAWLDGVRARIDRELTRYLDEKLAEARRISPGSVELVEGIRSLTLRGGKRLRPVVLDAAYRCVADDPSDEATTAAGASLELLQSYLLIHDDWMDQDDERRGGPAVHKIYRDAGHEEHLANSLAILAGDLAGAYAWELMLDAPFPERRRRAGIDRFLTIQKEVYFGQHLDVSANPDVSRMHDLKTGSYTVRGPLLLGALLGDASDAQVEAMLRYGDPLGEAFQLADDLIGTFGEAGETGKPGDDLLHKKRNALVSAAEKTLSEDDRAPLTALFAAETPSADQVGAATELLIRSGVRAQVEARLTELLAAAHAALDAAPFGDAGVQVLRFVADKLAIRTI